VRANGIVPVVNPVEVRPYFGNTDVRGACMRQGIAIEV
jgi:diketogulonate reductase-like aldo/keto reductase